ncbi:MAG: DUF2442 domain-containing protein [Anaerolineales bacterium]|nr:DUF2442 domain-containing protein [Chloroflexota bacterium]MBL6981383.1 DUF2442 domain-containing protein [Anaerolineales bacterium]
MENLRKRIRFRLNLTKSLYNITLPTSLIIFFSPLLIIILYIAIFLPASTRPFALLMVEENYPVELITFFGYFFAGILGLILAWQSWKRKEGIMIFGIYTLFSLGMLFIGMEEISWGQTFFRFNTPIPILQVNMQQEINIHNLKGLQGNSEFFFVAFGLGGIFGIWLFSLNAYRIASVPAILILWFLIITTIGGIDLFNDFIPIHSKLDTLVITLSEVIEMLIALAGFLYLWLNSRMLSYGKLRQALASDLEISKTNLKLILDDDRSIQFPLTWFPQLLQSPPDKLNHWQITHNGLRIYWPSLKVNLRVKVIPKVKTTGRGK